MLVKFSTPFVFETYPVTSSQKALECIDDYFFLKGKKACVFVNNQSLKAQSASLRHITSSWYMTALKVLSYFTIICPLVMLLAKFIARSLQPHTILKHNGMTRLPSPTITSGVSTSLAPISPQHSQSVLTPVSASIKPVIPTTSSKVDLARQRKKSFEEMRDELLEVVPELAPLIPYLAKRSLLNQINLFEWAKDKDFFPNCTENCHTSSVFWEAAHDQLRILRFSQDPAFALVRRFPHYSNAIVQLCIAKLAIFANSDSYRSLYPVDLDKYINPKHQLHNVKNWEDFDIDAFVADKLALVTALIFVKELLQPYSNGDAGDHRSTNFLKLFMEMDHSTLFANSAKKTMLMAGLTMEECDIVKSWKHLDLADQCFLMENRLILDMQQKAALVETDAELEDYLSALISKDDPNLAEPKLADLIALNRHKVSLPDLVWVLRLCSLRKILGTGVQKLQWVCQLVDAFRSGMVLSIEDVLAEKPSILAALASTTEVHLKESLRYSDVLQLLINLKRLKIYQSGDKIITLSNHDQLESLTIECQISDCELATPPDVSHCLNLKELNISGFPKLKEAPDLSKNKALKKLCLDHNGIIKAPTIHPGVVDLEYTIKDNPLDDAEKAKVLAVGGYC